MLTYRNLDAPSRTQFILDFKQADVNKEHAAWGHIEPLTEEQKINLFKLIRFSYLPHDELLSLS